LIDVVHRQADLDGQGADGAQTGLCLWHLVGFAEGARRPVHVQSTGLRASSAAEAAQAAAMAAALALASAAWAAPMPAGLWRLRGCDAGPSCLIDWDVCGYMNMSYQIST